MKRNVAPRYIFLTLIFFLLPALPVIAQTPESGSENRGVALFGEFNFFNEDSTILYGIENKNSADGDAADGIEYLLREYDLRTLSITKTSTFHLPGPILFYPRNSKGLFIGRTKPEAGHYQLFHFSLEMSAPGNIKTFGQISEEYYYPSYHFYSGNQDKHIFVCKDDATLQGEQRTLVIVYGIRMDEEIRFEINVPAAKKGTFLFDCEYDTVKSSLHLLLAPVNDLIDQASLHASATSLILFNLNLSNGEIQITSVPRDGFTIASPSLLVRDGRLLITGLNPVGKKNQLWLIRFNDRSTTAEKTAIDLDLPERNLHNAFIGEITGGNDGSFLFTIINSISLTPTFLLCLDKDFSLRWSLVLPYMPDNILSTGTIETCMYTVCDNDSIHLVFPGNATDVLQINNYNYKLKNDQPTTAGIVHMTVNIKTGKMHGRYLSFPGPHGGVSDILLVSRDRIIVRGIFSGKANNRDRYTQLLSLKR